MGRGKATGSRHRVTGRGVGEPLPSPAVLCKRWRRGRGGGTLCGPECGFARGSVEIRESPDRGNPGPAAEPSGVGGGSGGGAGGGGPVWAGEASSCPVLPVPGRARPGDPGVRRGYRVPVSPAAPHLRKQVWPSAVRLWRGFGCPVGLLCCLFPPLPSKRKVTKTKNPEFSSCLTCCVFLRHEYKQKNVEIV